MYNFKTGQKLIYISTDLSLFPGVPNPLIKGNIYTYDGHSEDYMGYIYIGLTEVNDIAFNIKGFRPLNLNSAIKELVESFVEVKETSDSPIKELV